MPIVRIPNIGMVRFPDDMSHDDIVSAIENDIIPNYKAPTGGIAESLKGGFKHGIVSSETALKSLFGDEDKAATEALAEHAAIKERPPVSLDEIKRRYYQEGLLPAVGETAHQIPNAIAANFPTIAEMYAGAKLGKKLGGTKGALVGSVAAPFLMNTGANLERQAEVQQAAEQPVDVSLGKAAATAIPQTAIERMFGVEGALFGRGAAKEGAKEGLEALAKESTMGSLLKGATRVAAEEIPEEVAQTAMERGQANLPVLGDEAYDEYKRAAAEAAMVGPMGGPIRMMERSDAQRQLAEQKAREEQATAEQADEAQKRLPLMQRALPAPSETQTDESVIQVPPGGFSSDIGAPEQEDIIAAKAQEAARQQAEQAQATADAQAQAQTDEAQQVAAAPIQEPVVTPPTITLAKKLGIHPNSNLGKALNGLDTSDPNNAIAASDMLRAAEGSYKGKINEDAVNQVHAVAEQMRSAQQAGTPTPPQQVTEPVVTPTPPTPPQQAEATPLNLHDIPTNNGASKVVDYGERKIVMADVNGTPVPFYLSTGLGGKEDVAAGKWYPILGLGKKGWINKGSQEDINNYYGSKELKDTANRLDTEIGDIRGETSHPSVEARSIFQREGDKAAIDFINSPFDTTPAESHNAPNASEALSKNIQGILGKISGEAKPAEVAETPLNRDAIEARINEIETRMADRHLLEKDEIDALRGEKKTLTEQLKNLTQGKKQESALTENQVSAIDRDTEPQEDLDRLISTILNKKPAKAASNVSDIQQEVDKHLKGSDFVNVVQSVKDLPGEGHNKNTQGWFDEDSGQVHLVADNLKAENVKDVLLHEIGVHRNLKGMVGEDRYNSILADLQRRLNNKDESVAAARKAVPKDTPVEHIPEEMLAYLVERGDKSSSIKALLSHVKEFVHGLTGIKFKLNDADLRHLASKALRHELGGGAEVTRRKTGKGKASVAASKAAESVLNTPYTVQRTDEEKGSFRERIGRFADRLMKEHVDKWYGIDKKLSPLFGEYSGEKLNAALQGHYYDQAHNVLARGYSVGGFKIRADGTPEVTKVSYKRHDGTTGYASLQHMQELADHIDKENGRAIAAKIFYIKDAERQMRLDAKKLPTKIKEDMPAFHKARKDVDQLLKEEPQYKDILKMWDALNENLINFSFDSGLINQETKDFFLKEKGYLPRYMLREQILDRMGPDDKAATQIGNTYTKVFRERTESDHEINPWENMSRHYTGVVMGGWNNLVKTAVAEQMSEAGAAKKVGNTQNPSLKGDLAIMRDGKREFYKLDDPTDMPVMIFLNQELGPLMQVARGGAKVLRTTALNNPAYWFRQIIRDPIQASLTTDVGWITPAETMRELLSIAQGTNEIYNKLKDVGVIGHVDPVSDPRFSREFTHNIGRAATEKSKSAKALRSLANMSEVTHVAVDGATRVAVYRAAYKQAKKRGMSDQRAESYAIMKARESINFSVSGASQRSRELRILIPFMSAGVNSLNLLYKAAFDPRASAAERADSMQRFRSKAYMMAGMSAMYALMMAGNDDYEEQDDNFKYNNILLPTGDKEHPFIGLSLPPDLAFIKWVPEMMVRYAVGTQDGSKIWSAAGHQLQAMVPGGMGYTYGVPIPQIVRPYLEGVVFGKSAYTGENIESRADMGKPIVERGAKKASETANFLSKDVGLSNIGLSPAVIDHLFRGYFAEMGKVGLWLTDKVAAPEGKPEKASMDWAKTPGLGLQGLFGRPQGSQFVSDMYDNKEIADQARKRLNDLKKEHTPDKRAELRELYQDKEEMAKARSADEMDNYAKRITVLNKRIDMIQNSNIDPDLKRERIKAIKENVNKIALQADKFWQSRVVKAGG